MEQLHRQWQTKSAGGFGFADDDPAVFAAAAILSYLEETQKTSLGHLRPLRRHIAEDHLSIDPASWRSLEIDRTMRSGGTEGTLLAAIDRERPLNGRPLNDVLTWTRASHAAGCYCEPDSRQHKWALVLETIHYALAREEE